jgi:hypothetical protein
MAIAMYQLFPKGKLADHPAQLFSKKLDNVSF